MKSLTIDWSTIGTREEFYDRALGQMEAPSWHGRNLDALHDSWVTGGICPSGPPFAFRFSHSSTRSGDLHEFADRVEEIARCSTQNHGGSFSVEDLSQA